MKRHRNMRNREEGRLRAVPLLVLAFLFLCAAGTAAWFLFVPGENTEQTAERSDDSPEQTPELPDTSMAQVPEQPDGTEEKATDGKSGEEALSEEEIICRQVSGILEQMSVEEKVGQMFIARCPEESAAEKAGQYQLGGYILFARDFEGKTKEQVSSDTASYQSVSEIPMLIGVDEEGGTVTRVSRYTAFRDEPFLSPQELYQEGGFAAIAEDTVEKCSLLGSLGINVNFAPVCDVSESAEDFIYERSFGQNAKLTSEYVRTVVEAMDGQGVACVLKHFPGYGNNTDTHTGISYDNRAYETFETSDFLPFQAGMESGAQMVLVSHNIVSSMDDQYPASLSAKVHEILREKLGFSGVIVTDDLVMEGIRDFTDDGQAAVLAVQAGNDLLCCTDFETQIPAVIAAVERGDIQKERIDESVRRILEMKIKMGLIRAENEEV